MQPEVKKKKDKKEKRKKKSMAALPVVETIGEVPLQT